MIPKMYIGYLLLLLLVFAEGVHVSKRIEHSSQRSLGGKTARKQNAMVKKVNVEEEGDQTYHSYDKAISKSMGELVGCDSGDQGDCLDKQCTQAAIKNGGLVDANTDDLAETMVKNTKQKVMAELLKKQKRILASVESSNEDIEENHDTETALVKLGLQSKTQAVFCTVAAICGLIATTTSAGSSIYSALGGVDEKAAKATALALHSVIVALDQIKDILKTAVTKNPTLSNLRWDETSPATPREKIYQHTFDAVKIAERKIKDMKSNKYKSENRYSAEKTCMHPGMMWGLGILTVGIYAGVTYGIVKHDNHHAALYLDCETELTVIHRSLMAQVQFITNDIVITNLN